MTELAASEPTSVAEPPPQSPARIFWRQLRKSPLAIIGGVVLIAMYAMALLAPFLAPYSQEYDRVPGRIPFSINVRWRVRRRDSLPNEAPRALFVRP